MGDHPETPSFLLLFNQVDFANDRLLDQDKAKQGVGGLRHVELAEEHAGGVGGDEDDGEEQEAADVQPTLPRPRVLRSRTCSWIEEDSNYPKEEVQDGDKKRSKDCRHEDGKGNRGEAKTSGRVGSDGARHVRLFAQDLVRHQPVHKCNCPNLHHIY